MELGFYAVLVEHAAVLLWSALLAAAAIRGTTGRTLLLLFAFVLMIAERDLALCVGRLDAANSRGLSVGC